MKASWLRECLGKAESSQPAAPEWRPFAGQIQAGDELWRFSSGTWSWYLYCGRAGVALVRQGRIVASVVQGMN